MNTRKKILVIEDDKDIRKFLTFRIECSGFEVITAEDGLAGLEKARKEAPDLVILDLRLPKMSGQEVCKAIREDSTDEHFSHTPIIMLTGEGGDVDRVIGMVIGANSYMTKPFESQKLMKEIFRFTGLKNGSGRVE